MSRLLTPLLHRVAAVSLLAAGTLFAGARAGAEPAATSATRFPATVEFLRLHTYVLTREIRLYHWFDAADADPSWRDKLASTSAVGREYARRVSRSYWSNRAVPDSADYYGLGFYAALDPAATRSYGRRDWVLIELRLPTGFRMLDDMADGDEWLPAAAREEMIAEGCPRYLRIDSLLMPQAAWSARCRAAIHHLLEEELRIDGFAYKYQSHRFPACDPDAGAGVLRQLGSLLGSVVNPKPDLAMSAFVITSDRWLGKNPAARVRSYNAHTEDAPEDRRRIQAMLDEARVSPDPLWSDARAAGAPEDLAPWLRANHYRCDGRAPYVPVAEAGAAIAKAGDCSDHAGSTTPLTEGAARLIQQLGARP